MIINDITEDNPKFLRLVKANMDRECDVKETKKLNKMWNDDYKKQGYTFLSREDILKEVSKILE